MTIKWSVSTIRDKVINLLKETLGLNWLTTWNIKINKIYLKDNNIVVEGEYKYINEVGKYVISLNNEDLSLIEFKTVE
jgi:hypothetical protein